MKVRNLVALSAAVSLIAMNAAFAVPPVNTRAMPANADGTPTKVPPGVYPLTANNGANDCSSVAAEGVLPVLGGSFSGDTGPSTDTITDAAGSAFCGGDYGSGGNDGIHGFQVAQNGTWSFDTGCPGQTNVFDTSIHLREDVGGGCPGDIISCNGDGCGGTFGSTLVDFLVAGTDYFLVVEGYSAFQRGPYTVDYSQVIPPCTLDADCSDGDACNGAETCDANGQCQGGSNLCPPWQTCDSVLATCGASPADCFSELKAPSGNFFFPADVLGGAGNADEITLRVGAGRELISYSFEIIARDRGEGLVGDTYTVTTDIYTVGAGANPDTAIPGTQCVLNFIIQPGGSPADIALCEPNGGLPTGVILAPGFFGSEGYIVHRTSDAGAGFLIADELPKPVQGDLDPSTADGLSAVFNTGGEIFWVEDAPFAEGWAPTFFGANPGSGVNSDFGAFSVCTEPAGPCQVGTTCVFLNPDQCATAGGTLPLGLNTLDQQTTCADSDFDGDGVLAGVDNCPDVANADQANADGDAHGDACDNCVNDANDDQANGDADSHGDACDNCPATDNEDQANADGDIHGDVCDNCVDTANDDQANGDADTFGDACDNCPADDNEDQADCGLNGVGDVCDVNTDGDALTDDCDNCVNSPNDDQADGDADGVGDVCDNCPIDANTNQVDGDNDGTGDACDNCPADPNKIDPGVCGCGVADQGDSDNDNVLDCVDTCPGADDAVFGECRNNIPTVSEWGLVVLALLLLVAGKVYYGRRSALN